MADGAMPSEHGCAALEQQQLLQRIMGTFALRIDLKGLNIQVKWTMAIRARVLKALCVVRLRHEYNPEGVY